MKYLTQKGLKILNELKAPSIRGTLAAAAARVGTKAINSSPKVSGKTGQSTRSQSPNWSPQQKKEIGRTMGRYKSKVVGGLEHKFGTGTMKSWGQEPVSLAPHNLDAWRKTARSGKVTPVSWHDRHGGSWPDPNLTPDELKAGEKDPTLKTYRKFVSTNTNPRYRTVDDTGFRTPHELGQSYGTPGSGGREWPLSSDRGDRLFKPDTTNLGLGKDLAWRKGSGNLKPNQKFERPRRHDLPEPKGYLGQGTYRGPGDTIAPRSKPAPATTAAPKTPEKKIDPETNRMAHADRFDPEKQHRQQLDRVSDVMRQQRDTKKNVNFSDFNPKLSAQLRRSYADEVYAGQMQRKYAPGTSTEDARKWLEKKQGEKIKALRAQGKLKYPYN